jgi:hypothetical protein
MNLLTRLRTRLRVPFAVSTLTLLAGMTLAVLPAEAAPVEPATSSASGAPADEAGFTGTKTLTRSIVMDDGSTYSFPTNTVTVKASETKQLRGRQRIQISWTGAQPSGARASDPYGERGLKQEYPVVIMQCRGTDDASLPTDQQLRPETCWTQSVDQRSQVTRSEGEASWVHDSAADASQKQRVSGEDPFPAAACPNADITGLYTHLTPFVAASGKVYPACSSEQMPPEAAVGAAFPAAEIAAYSDENGAGSVQFEVRSDVENESLGCNAKTACSIVVIPINGLSCDQPSAPQTLSDSACRNGGQFLPGSSNYANQGVDQAVSPTLWWSATNWQNRISIPITMGLPPDTCDVLDPRAPTGFYGSELMAQAALQWAPAYCLNKKRFKFQLNQMSDAAGWNLMESGVGPAAFVSSSHRKTSDDPVAFAPTAVTGFGIGYNIDRPNNAGEYTGLRLTPRLVAKLLTQSYIGSDLGRAHPGMATNPVAIMNDPDFKALNPGLSEISQEAGATLLSLSNDSDLVEQLTEWIAQDQEAMDFVNGKADPWGMVVNPSYKKIKLPRDEWPLLDSYIPQTADACRQANPAVYFTQVAAPVTTLRKISDALLDGWPNVQTKCEFDTASTTYKLSRVERQGYGSRFMLGLISLGDADRFGLRTAALQTKKGTFVAPTAASMKAAVDLMEPHVAKKGKKASKAGTSPDGAGDVLGRVSADDDAVATDQPLELDQADVRRSRKAYPGTMVVYTAAKSSGLAKADATKVAEFIRVSTTEGQKEGPGNGELPGGFVPIAKSGATKKLYAQARQAADEVEAQTPVATESPEPTESASATPSPEASAETGGVDEVPTADLPTDVPTDDAPATAEAAPTETATAEAAAVEMPATQAVNSDMGNRAVPLLLVAGLLGLALTSAVRFFVRPPKGSAR